MSTDRGMFSNIRGDFFGGLTAGIVALPLALAFGEQTDLGAIAGLYGAIVIAILAAVFGGTKTQISGPTAPMTVVSALIISDAIEYAGDLESAFPIIVATFLMAGFFEALFGVLRLGNYIRYIPYPVVSGFMSGIGVIIVITQIFPFFGVAAPSGGPMGTIRGMHTIPELVNGIIYGFPRITKKIPAALVALVFVSGLAYFLVPATDILRINSEGLIPTGLPDLQLGFVAVFSNYDHMVVVVEYALTLAALGAIDSLLTSVVADNMTKTRHNSNKELIGQGIGNMASALVGGLPGAGATMRTVINIKSGGRTQLSGVVAGMFLLAVLLGLGALVGHIPNAVLSGILITVGIGIIDYKGLRHLRSVPRSDAAIMIIVLLLTVFVDLLVAVGVGMVLASLLFMKSISEVVENGMHSAPLAGFAREVPWSDEGDLIAREGHRVYINHLDGPLFFGFANRFQEIVQNLGELEVVILRMERVPHIDQSGLYALEEAIMDLHGQDIIVAVVGLSGQPEDMARRIRLIPGLISEQNCFTDFAAAMDWLRTVLSEPQGSEAARQISTR